MPLQSHLLPIEGFNASIIRSDSDPHSYYGTIRRQHVISKTSNPTVKNELFTFTLSSDTFKLKEFQKVADLPGRTIHTNWTTGVEDVRLIDLHTAVGVTLDTNPNWRIEMSLLQGLDTAALTRVQPMLIIGAPPQRCEKNWLFLRHNGPAADFLYSCSPLKIVRINTDTGQGNVLIQKTETLRLPGEIHNGAALQLPDGRWLVSARVIVSHKYKESRFLLFDSDFNLLKMSHPFYFSSDFSTQPSYEMNMSLLLENDGETITACVSIGDRDVYINQYLLKDILAFIMNA